MTIQPIIRIILTFIAAALAVVVASVHSETVRLVGSALVVGLAAIGIVPPQVPTRTVVARKDDVVSVKSEGGYAQNGLLVVVVVVILTIVAIHFFGLWGLLLLLLLLLLFA